MATRDWADVLLATKRGLASIEELANGRRYDDAADTAAVGLAQMHVLYDRLRDLGRVSRYGDNVVPFQRPTT